MLFSSYSFIFYFLPITLIGYYLLNRLSSKLQGNHNRNPLGKTWLLLMSLFFYSYFHINYLFLIVASILLNFLFGKLMQKHKHSVILALGIVLNLGLLGYFKYWDFFMETLNQVFSTNWSY
ncbi:MAG: MBOAT family protein, partial [Lachnospiraceae bacterium]|nr:MBOAT family protein [Lachnospiraceae bacterium]